MFADVFCDICDFQEILIFHAVWHAARASCSTSSPGGNQVDGLPPAAHASARRVITRRAATAWLQLEE